MNTPNTTNYQKYKTKNILVRKLIDNFQHTIENHIQQIQPSSLLDVGCGEGEILKRLQQHLPEKTQGVDLNPDCVAYCQSSFPEYQFQKASIYDLPYPDNSFDAVICLEVLEHLEHPQKALESLVRVAKNHLLLSVPLEPFFRIGSLLRGKYVTSWGNHPEHVQHWNRRSFKVFLEDNPQLQKVWVGQSFPWVVARCEIKKD